MNVKQLQEWLNTKGATLKTDGIGGPATRSAFIKAFVNKNATKITEQELIDLAKKLGDTSSKRIKAVGKVESSGSAYNSDGLVKILYERHYFYKFVKKNISYVEIPGAYLAYPSYGGYTLDADNDGINDSWEKLSYAVCIDPVGALSSVSIGMFQVMGIYYKELGYNNPIELLWDASRGEKAHYNMLAGYILNVAKIKSSFLKISTKASDNEPFCRAYNGPKYKENQYHTKLAKAML